MARLVGISEGIKEKVFSIKGRKATVGRQPDNTICLPHEMVSGCHAELYQEGSQWFVRNLNATNGTFVNGARVDEMPIHNGDSIQFGYVALKFSDTKDHEEAPFPPREVVPLSDTSAQMTPSIQPDTPLCLPGIEPKKSHKLLLFSLIGIGSAVIILLIMLIVRLLQS